MYFISYEAIPNLPIYHETFLYTDSYIKCYKVYYEIRKEKKAWYHCIPCFPSCCFEKVELLFQIPIFE